MIHVDLLINKINFRKNEAKMSIIELATSEVASSADRELVAS